MTDQEIIERLIVATKQGRLVWSRDTKEFLRGTQNGFVCEPLGVWAGEDYCWKHIIDWIILTHCGCSVIRATSQYDSKQKVMRLDGEYDAMKRLSDTIRDSIGDDDTRRLSLCRHIMEIT